MKKLLIALLPLLFILPHAAHAALTTNIVSYWKLDESSGNAADSAGSNTLTNVGTMTYGPGIINNGAQPNSTGPKYLSISDASQSGLDFGTGNFSINLWVKLSTQTGEELIEKQFLSGSGGYYQISQGTGGNAGKAVMTAGNTSSGNTASVVSASSIIDGTWKMLTLVRTGNTVEAYVNAVSQGTNSAGGSIDVSNDGSFFVGHGNNGTATGSIDELGVWSRALTGTEITQLYNSGVGCQYNFTACPATGPSIILPSIYSWW